MAISENKMQIVIDNYFKSECDINPSIRSAFEKGFRIGVKKASSAQPEQIRCKDCKHRPIDSEDTQGFGVEFPDEKCPCQCDEDGWYNWRPDDEWFCANAERRTDD